MRQLPVFLALALVALSPVIGGGTAEAASKKARAAAAVKAKRAAVRKAAAKARAAEPELGAADPLDAAPPATASTTPNRGPSRLDFDDRLIQGQTNKSGAVYLYDRKELVTRSMIKERESFRAETLSTVYDP